MTAPKAKSPKPSKAAWLKKFEATIASAPKIKDAGYVEWLAAVSFIQFRDDIPMAKVSELLGIQRTYIYKVMRGWHIVRQDVLENGASNIGGYDSIEAFRAFGRELLGGSEHIKEIMKRVVVERVIIGLDEEGKLLIQDKSSFSVSLDRKTYNSWWGDLEDLALFVFGKTKFIVDTEVSPKKLKKISHVLMTDDAGHLSVERYRVKDEANVKGIVVWTPPAIPTGSQE